MMSGTPPALADVERLAERALSAIPERFRQHLHDVAIIVEERPDDEIIKEMDLDLPWDLTGLYRGTPLPERSIGDVARQPPQVFLFREPILLEWIETGVDLFDLVRNVLVHEVAHHFGFSDAEIEALEQEVAGQSGR